MKNNRSHSESQTDTKEPLPNAAPSWSSLPKEMTQKFAEDEYEKFASVIDDWPISLGELKKDNLFTTLSALGMPTRKLAGMATAIESYFEAQTHPINVLAKAKSRAQHDWLLSHPLVEAGELPKTVNLPVLQAAFFEAERVALEALKRDDSKGPRLLCVQSGMGNGKSHIIDVADQLLFVGKDPLVIKVAFDCDQVLTYERSKAAKGLFARLILGYHKNVAPGEASVHVEGALRKENGRLVAKSVVEWLRAQGGGADTRPIIIAVDEIGCLHDEQACRDVLSAIGLVVSTIWNQSDGKQEAIGLVTALPSVDVQCLSQRQPFFVQPEALN